MAKAATTVWSSGCMGPGSLTPQVVGMRQRGSRGYLSDEFKLHQSWLRYNFPSRSRYRGILGYTNSFSESWSVLILFIDPSSSLSSPQLNYNSQLTESVANAKKVPGSLHHPFLRSLKTPLPRNHDHRNQQPLTLTQTPALVTASHHEVWVSSKLGPCSRGIPNHQPRQHGGFYCDGSDLPTNGPSSSHYSHDAGIDHETIPGPRPRFPPTGSQTYPKADPRHDQQEFR
ncbi:hypothetical protein K457DRAFT_1879327 [Linnemannia elongata AG-77]|uniref:Uncharacterized protein n=1 Tax=Linnemannia elongata AG-77 TaxID=1314771 RepID=A0A197JMW6_9FUNG|nr:hypothetical protein K457DRAFT_1879327 [Linnemannia elongata AG-77]